MSILFPEDMKKEQKGINLILVEQIFNIRGINILLKL